MATQEEIARCDQIVNYECSVCHQQCFVVPLDPSAKAYCQDCCPEHEWEYDIWRRGDYCKICDEEFYNYYGD